VGDVLLIHAGIADSRMWRPQLPVLTAAGYRVHAPDLRGFGQHPLETEPFSYVRDIEALLERPCAVVGASLGGRVALELAVLRRDLVERLVLIAPGISGWRWSDQTRAGWAEEDSAFQRGDRDAAAEASLQLWIDRARPPESRLDPGTRELVREMVLRSYELQATAWDNGAEETPALDPPIHERLREIRCPTLVIVGADDVDDMQAVASHLARAIEDGSLVTVPSAAHLPSLEKPSDVNATLLAFLGSEPEAPRST